MRILLLCGAGFDGPSEKQALGLAQALMARGHAVAVAIPDDAQGPERETVGHSLPEILRWSFRGREPSAPFREAAARFAPDVVHLFAPRRPLVALARALGSPAWVVHFEDDEWGLARSDRGDGFIRRVARIALRTASMLRPALWQYATEHDLERVRRHAAVLEALTPALAMHVEERLGRPCSVVLPVLPELAPAAVVETQQRSARTLIYTGAVFAPHLPDFLILLRALALLHREGHAVRLIHAGRVSPRFPPSWLLQQAALPADAIEFLGDLPLTRIPDLLRSGDVLVQPGAPSAFNRLRLPSKLQAYLASGRPVVTFAAGFGELLRDGEECVLTRTGEPRELAAAIARILDDPELRDRLGAGGASAAERLFNRDANAAAMEAVYERARAVTSPPGHATA